MQEDRVLTVNNLKVCPRIFSEGTSNLQLPQADEALPFLTCRSSYLPNRREMDPLQEPHPCHKIPSQRNLRLTLIKCISN